MDAKDRPTAVASCIRHNNRIYRLKVSDVDLVHFSWRMDLNYLIPTVIAMTATISPVLATSPMCGLLNCNSWIEPGFKPFLMCFIIITPCLSALVR